MQEIEAITVTEVDGRLVADRFPERIGVSRELLEQASLDHMAIAISFTFANGGATYRVTDRRSGIYFAEREAFALEGVTYG